MTYSLKHKLANKLSSIMLDNIKFSTRVEMLNNLKDSLDYDGMSRFNKILSNYNKKFESNMLFSKFCKQVEYVSKPVIRQYKLQKLK